MHYAAETFQELIYLTNEVEKEKQKVLVQNERESNDTSKIIIVILIVVQCAGSALVCVSSFVLVFSHFRIVHYSQFTHV